MTKFEIIMARKPKNANIDIRQTAKVFNEQAFVDGVFNDDYILVVGSEQLFLRFCNLFGFNFVLL